MVLEGFQVLRFTGSEVFHDAERCAAEVEALLVRAGGETLERYRNEQRVPELVG